MAIKLVNDSYVCGVDDTKPVEICFHDYFSLPICDLFLFWNVPEKKESAQGEVWEALVHIYLYM